MKTGKDKLQNIATAQKYLIEGAMMNADVLVLP